MDIFELPQMLFRTFSIDVGAMLTGEEPTVLANRKKTMHAPKPAPAPLFKILKGTQKSYVGPDGAEVVAFSVSGPSLLIKPGLTAILAPSGRGKSTLLNLIGGIDTPTAGRVYFEGQPLPSYEGAELQMHRARQVGFTFQSLNLITHLSALENVALPLIASGVDRGLAVERAGNYLGELGVSDEEMLRTPGALSGGQQQRIAVVRAAASTARVILADEPTGALDDQNAQLVMGLFKDLTREGKSVVFVTHNIELARKYADRIIFLEAGGQYRVVEQPDGEVASDAAPIRRAAPAVMGKPGLGWFECVRYAWSDLRHRWKISAITVVTVAFAVYYLLAIAMLCIRFYDTRDQALRQAQLEKVEAYPEQADAVNLRFTEARVAEIRRWPEVRVLFPSVEIYANVSLGNDQAQLLVLSSTAPDDPQTNSNLLWGRGIEAGRDQAVISKAVLTRLGGRLTPSGPEPRTLTLELQRKVNGKEQAERRLVPIVGVSKFDSRERVFVPLPLARLVDNWSKGLIADLNGRLHKEEENPTVALAIAYGPAEEERRAMQELGDQRLDVKKLGAVSIIDFSGTAWTYIDVTGKSVVDELNKQPGFEVHPVHRAKIGSQTWIAWEKKDPRWLQIDAPERDELGWVGAEQAAELPALTNEHAIPAGLIPPGTLLTNKQTLRWLLFELRDGAIPLEARLFVDRKAHDIRLVPHSATKLRANIEHHQIVCSVKLTEAGIGELRPDRGGTRLLETKPIEALPPDIGIVHDDVFRQLVFLAEDEGTMPAVVETMHAIGVERPVLLAGMEKIAGEHKYPLTWLTPIQRRLVNKYEVKEKDQPMKIETVRWLTSMKPAIDFAQALPAFKARLKGDIWTLVGTEAKSPRAFEACLRAGHWLDGQDALQVVIAADLAQKQQLSVGDAVTFHVLRNEDKGEHAIPLRLKVIGIAGDNQSYVHAALCRNIGLWRSRALEFNEARHAFESPLEVHKDLGDHRLVLFARSEAGVKSLVQRLREQGYRTEDRLHEMESMRQLSLVLTAFASFFIFGFVFMSLVTVMVTTRMHVQAKTFEIGILKSIGLSSWNVLRIFIVQGIFIGAVGFLTAALAFAATGNGMRFGVAHLFSINDPVFTAGNPFGGGHGIMLHVVVLAGLLTIAQSCFGVLVGCWFACRLKPHDALRRIDQ